MHRLWHQNIEGAISKLPASGRSIEQLMAQELPSAGINRLCSFRIIRLS